MEERAPDTTNQSVIQLHSSSQSAFSQAMAARADSPSRRGGVKVQAVPAAVKHDDLEELDEEDEGDEMVQEVEPPVDYSDALNDPTGAVPGQYHLWSVDWGDLDQERRSRKRPVLEDLPDDVREELACMSGADTELRPKQKPKLEPPESVRESSRGRKSPADEEGVPDISAILSKPAKTAEERLAVLEARDKLIRIRSNQQRCPRLKNMGKCPDMCPEKERYQRIARHQVDYYEYYKDTKEVNLASMVKIYARSSADQQMPLPHDLRPVSVLWMTMSYLVNQFMDLADSPGENLGEWYHFLWDRMRSIRKDITQLALCDTLSVQILEMCARFHIFCMERLREEKMAVFDEKINRENLTKCLQSLQYMYNDLFLKNVSCPNEPEFQAYSILLHINSDLCTSTILGLRPEMRQHKKVQFAINAFLAVTMKNYVRFFKLVKSTTYLNACILHQYFAQVRAHAMLSIIRAYSRQKMRNTYPLSELQTQLLFDSIDDVFVFCRFSKVPVEDNNIVLEKTSHPIPMQEKMKRSFVGVECKRQSSIRNIVAGGCRLADTATFHKVHDSFDENGVLKQEAWYAEDQELSLLNVDMQKTDTLSKTAIESSGPKPEQHGPELSGVSTVQEHVSPVPSHHFVVTQSGVLQTQNSGVTDSQKNIFGVSKPISSSPHLHDRPFVMQHKSEESIHVREVESNARPLDQQNSSGLMKPVVSSSSLTAEQSSMKSFVFRLPDAKSENKDGRPGQSGSVRIVPTGFVSRTLQSIFGGAVSNTTTATNTTATAAARPSTTSTTSSITITTTPATTAVNRSPGTSVLRSAHSGKGIVSPLQTVESTTSGYWGSPPQDVNTSISSTQNVQNMSQIDATHNTVVNIPQQKNSDPFKNPALASSSVAAPLLFPDSFDNRRRDLWGSNTINLPGSLQSFVSASGTIDPLTVTVSSSVPNQFPESVFALPSQTSTEMSDTKQKDSLTVPPAGSQIFPKVSSQISSPFTHVQQISDTSQASPLHIPARTVTISTSNFDLHSRPLTTPQIFPTSNVPSVSVSVSHPVTLNAPASSVASRTAISGMSATTKPVTAISNFSFSVSKYAPVISSQSSMPVATSSVGSLVDNSITSEKPVPNETCELSPELDDVYLMEVDSDYDLAKNSEQLGSPKLDKCKATSPATETVSALSLLSPIFTSNLEKEYSFPTSKVSQQKADEYKRHRMKEVVYETFRQWRLFAYRSKLRRRLQSQDKCVPMASKFSLEEQVLEFPMPKGCIAVDYQTRLEHLLFLEDIKFPQSVFPCIGKLRLENIVNTVFPIPRFEKGNLEASMFWKLCISLPSELEGKKFSLLLNEWVDATFSDNSEDDLLRITRTLVGEKYNLFTSVQKTVGVVEERLKGVNGLLFFAPRCRLDNKYAYERYQSFVESTSFQFSLPLIAVVSNALWAGVCHEWFTADLHKKRIAAFKIIGPFGEQEECVSKDLIDSISWLTQNIRPAPPLEYWPLKEVLLELMTDLWTRVRFSLACRCSSGLLQHPEDLLGLYHDALKHLHKIVINEKMHEYGDVAPELKDLMKRTLGDKTISRIFLDNPENIKNINEGFSQVQLNICMPPKELLSVESFCEAVCSFNPKLRGPISHFLCSWNKDEDVDWTYILESLTKLHIRETIGKLNLRKVVVVFIKSEIQKFRMEPWYTHWLLDRLPSQKSAGETHLNNCSFADPVDQDHSITSQELNVTSFDPDEKLLSDFESMLNELEELKKTDLKRSSNLSNVFSSSSDSKNQTKCIPLDILESQLEYFANFLKH